jgi:hypothetical protein
MADGTGCHPHLFYDPGSATAGHMGHAFLCEQLVVEKILVE